MRPEHTPPPIRLRFCAASTFGSGAQQAGQQPQVKQARRSDSAIVPGAAEQAGLRRAFRAQKVRALAPFLVCVALSCLQLAGAQTPPAVEKITDHLYRVGAVTVDTRARTVTCRGEIGMDDGSVEYLAVTPQGKTYESLLRMSVRPIHLQVALLLLGLEPKNVLTHQGDRSTPQGAPVTLTVRWRDASGAQREARAEDLLARMPGRSAMPRHAWVFTGSRIMKEGFEADLSGSLVAVWHDPAAIMDNPLITGGDNDWIVNSARVPKRGTTIELVIHALATAADAQASDRSAQP